MENTCIQWNLQTRDMLGTVYIRITFVLCREVEYWNYRKVIIWDLRVVSLVERFLLLCPCLKQGHEPHALSLHALYTQFNSLFPYNYNICSWYYQLYCIPCGFIENSCVRVAKKLKKHLSEMRAKLILYYYDSWSKIIT